MAVGKCPQCDGKLEIPRKHSGTQICCAHCQHVFIAPALSSEPQSHGRASALASALDSLPLPNALKNESYSHPPDATSPETATPQSGSAESSPTEDTSAWPPGTVAPQRGSQQSPSQQSPSQHRAAPQNVPTTRNPAATPGDARNASANAPASPAASSPIPMSTPIPAAAASKTANVESPASETANSPGSANAPSSSATKPVMKPAAEPAQRLQQPSAPRTAKIRRQESAPISHDGQLPTLSLTEKPKRKPMEMPGWKSNPIFLAILFAISMLASAAILLVDFEPVKSNRATNSEAREKLKEFYEVRPGSPLEPYQLELRLAQQAYSRGNRSDERNHYRNVMTYLRAEDRNQYTGLTGSSDRDSELESYLSGLLKEAD